MLRYVRMYNYVIYDKNTEIVKAKSPFAYENTYLSSIIDFLDNFLNSNAYFHSFINN